MTSVIITDKNLFHHYKKTIAELGANAHLIVLPAGEKTKSLKTIERCAHKLSRYKFTRNDTIIAFGGGVIGDTAGLLASLYLRGTRLIHIPTSLLAMVDSSIGGKTGVNTVDGKNMLGTFYHPEKVILCTNFLKTLPKIELVNGMAEVIKYGICLSKNLYNFIIQERIAILKRDTEKLNKIIEQCIALKTKIVQKDERENGARMILNFGHTVGHAIEQASGHTIRHGAAIAIGMVYECRLAVTKGILKKNIAANITATLKAYGLPTTLPKNINRAKIKKALELDKKHRTTNDRERSLTLYLPTGIGRTCPITTTDEEIYAILD